MSDIAMPNKNSRKLHGWNCHVHSAGWHCHNHHGGHGHGHHGWPFAMVTTVKVARWSRWRRSSLSAVSRLICWPSIRHILLIMQPEFTLRKSDQHFSFGDYWRLFLLFHFPFYDIFDKSNCFNFEVPIDKETNNPFSGMIISSSNCSLHCVNISRYKLARINFFVAPKTFFPSQVALKLESAKQPKQVLKMEVSVVKIIFGFVSSAVHIMFIKIIFTILKIIFRYVSSVVHIIAAVNSKIFSGLQKALL